jgi:hypothetical protein
MMLMPVAVTNAFDFSQSKGPLSVRNFNPVQLMFLSLSTEEAELLLPGRSQIRMELAESSIIISEIHPNPDVDATLKFETFRFAFSYRYGITDRMEASLEIPVLYRDKGILDPFITSVEEAVSRLSPNRVEFSRGSFGGYSISRNGEILLSGDRGDFGLGDIVLQVKFLTWTEEGRWPALALRGAVKFPTGKKSELFGSGKMDFGLGVALQKTLHPRFVVYLNQNVVFPMGHFLNTDFSLNPISTTVLAFEWVWSPAFSWLTHLDYYTSPFHGTGVQVLDYSVSEIAFGFGYALRPHVLWQLYGIENFNKPYFGAATDFSLLTTVSYRF